MMTVANLSGLASLLMTGRADQRMLEPKEKQIPNYEERSRRIRRESEMEKRVRNMDTVDLVAEMIAHEDLRARIAAIANDFHPDADRDAPLALQEMREALLALVS